MKRYNFDIYNYQSTRKDFLSQIRELNEELHDKELEFLILICDQRKKNEFLIKFDYKKTLKSKQLCNNYLRILESKEFIFYEDGLIGINLHKFPCIKMSEVNRITERYTPKVGNAFENKQKED